MKALSKIALGVVLVIALGAAGMIGTRQFLTRDGAEAGQAGPQPVRVAVTNPRSRTVEDDFTGIGTIRPVEMVEIVPSVPGRVTEVPVSSGQDIAEGDVLIQLDDRAARAALSEAEASLGETEDALRRVEELAERETVAEARLEEARAAYLRAEAAVMAARADLEDRAVTAPLSGTLGLIDVERGAYLSGDAPVTTLADLRRVEVSVAVPERYFGRVASGQRVEVTVPAYPGRNFAGTVTVRAPGVDLETRTFEFRAEIDNSERLLVGGMFASTRLIFDTYEALAIPDDAIISEGLTSFVYTVSDGAAARTEIAAGASLGELTEVREGLAPEDRVVVAGWDNLSDGAQVEIDADTVQGGLE